MLQGPHEGSTGTPRRQPEVLRWGRVRLWLVLARFLGRLEGAARRLVQALRGRHVLEMCRRKNDSRRSAALGLVPKQLLSILCDLVGPVRTITTHDHRDIG